MSNAWLVWWSILCTVSVLNIGAWIVSARIIFRQGGHLTASDDTLRRQLLWLSGAYVLGCAFRSFLPMSDVPRMCLHDTWVSRIFIGRSVATVAELCFVAQWGLLLHDVATKTGDRLAKVLSRALVPLIVVAEVCSWTAVLTQNYLMHAVENSLWTLGAGLALVAIVSVRSGLDAAGRRVFIAALVSSLIYVGYMATVDVPMWLARWHGEAAAVHPIVPLWEGLQTTLARCVVVRDWTAWRDDVPWLSLYFTVCVWVSIALVHVPPLRRADRAIRHAARAVPDRY